MPTFAGRTIITMPDLPGPKAIDWMPKNLIGETVSTFSGRQQILDWNSSYLAATLTMPPLEAGTTATAWIAFLLACRGKASCFALPAGWTGFVAPVSNSGYFALATNEPKYSISDAGQLVGLVLDIREVLA